MPPPKPAAAPTAADYQPGNQPVSAAEFAHAMERLGPWDASRRVAVAVSGGPDSLALALLAREWGQPAAFIVDHALRPDSAEEAATARATLSRRGIPATILRLHGLHAGPGVAARARAARYAALAAACRTAGLVDLLLGHHAGDQAETVLLRQRAGSGPRGLAAMPMVAETTDIRLLRPLLTFPPDRLAAVVAQAGWTAASDPTNTDLNTTRARLRREIGSNRASLLATAASQARWRQERDASLATELASRVTLFPGGFAHLSPGPVAADALAAVLRMVSGRYYPVSGVAGLAAEPRAATVAGARLVPAGRLGPGWLVVREEAAMAGACAAAAGAVWDGRFRVGAAAADSVIGALRQDAAKVRRRSSWPAAVLRTLPALRRNGALSEVPHLGYLPSRDGSTNCVGRSIVHFAATPVAGAAYSGC